MTELDVAAFADCIARGGLVIFPADTVYGLAADPKSDAGVARLNALKRRDPAQPSAVMFFTPGRALAALPELGPATRAAFGELLPGSLTLIVANPARRYPLACGADPLRLGVRVPELKGSLAPLRAMKAPVVQSSANLHGGPDPCRLADVPSELRSAVDLELDGGELPGVPSTVVDLSGYEAEGDHRVLREGAVPASEVSERLAGIR